MKQPAVSFTAVFLHGDHGYDAFIVELPEINSHGRTIDDARRSLQRLAEVIFSEERKQCDAMLRGKAAVREPFLIPISPRAKRSG